MWLCICSGWQFEEIFDDYDKRDDDDDARDDDKGDDDDDKDNENDDHDRDDDSKCSISVFPFFVTSVTLWETTRETSGLRLSSSYNCLFAFCFSLFWLHTYKMKYEFKYSSLTTVLSVLFLTLSFLVLWIRKQIDIQSLRITSYTVYLLFAFPFPFHLYILLRVQCTFIDVCLRLCRTSWEQLKLSLRSTSLFSCRKWSPPPPTIVESGLLL